MLCACLSAAVLVGLGANAIAGGWADPFAALFVMVVAVREGREARRQLRLLRANRLTGSCGLRAQCTFHAMWRAPKPSQR